MVDLSSEYKGPKNCTMLISKLYIVDIAMMSIFLRGYNNTLKLELHCVNDL